MNSLGRAGPALPSAGSWAGFVLQTSSVVPVSVAKVQGTPCNGGSCKAISPCFAKQI